MKNRPFCPLFTYKCVFSGLIASRWHRQCLLKGSMKTLYLTKTLLPLLFLPVAPGVLQLELARQGLLTGNWADFVIAAQGIFTLGIIAWLGLSITRHRQKAFLRMSCVSK